MFNHDHWSSLIVDVAAKIKQARRETLRKLAAVPHERQGRIWVFFFCQAGKHRSVGIEFVCRHLMLKSGLRVSGPHRMSSGQWYRNNCQGCAVCSEGPEQKAISSTTSLRARTERTGVEVSRLATVACLSFQITHFCFWFAPVFIKCSYCNNLDRTSNQKCYATHTTCLALRAIHWIIVFLLATNSEGKFSAGGSGSRRGDPSGRGGCAPVWSVLQTNRLDSRVLAAAENSQSCVHVVMFICFSLMDVIILLALQLLCDYWRLTIVSKWLCCIAFTFTSTQACSMDSLLSSRVYKCINATSSYNQ